MKLASFQRVVARCERIAAQHPRAFEYGVGVMAALGYLYLTVVCVALLALFAVCAAGAVETSNGALALWAVIPLVTLVAVARSLRFRVQRIDGIEVSLTSVPALARLLAEISARSRGPRIDRLVIRVDSNASLSQYPRAGVLGRYESTLAIGMPLLLGFPPEELSAILAHEIAHLNGGHGRIGVWIARQITTYQSLERDQQSRVHRRFGRRLLYPLTQWYLPLLYAVHFALRRQHEYDADRFAAEFATPEVAQRALVRYKILIGWQQVVRDAVLVEMAREGRPVPTHMFDDYPARLAAEITPAKAGEWLDAALRVPTDFSDSHPALRDRLSAIGAVTAPRLPEWDPSARRALEWLAPIEAEVLARANVAWAAAATPGWHQVQKHLAALAERLKAIPADPGPDGFDVAREWERASLVEQREGPAAAGPLARAVVLHAPEHVGARFLVARSMLAEGDAAGLAELERLVARAPDLVRPAADLAFPFLWQRGARAEAEAWRQRQAEREALRVRAAAERSKGYRWMRLGPHRLSPEVLESLRAGVADLPQVKEIYIARRLVRLAPEIPSYVVGVVPRLPWGFSPTVQRLRAVSQSVLRAAPWPHETVVLPIRGELRGLRRKMRALEDAVVYPKPGS